MTMKKLFLLFGLLFASPAFAADNAVIVTPGVGVTMKSKDIGAGVQAMQPVISDTSGNALSTPTVGADGVSNTSTGLLDYSRMQIYNGTTWDRWQGAIKAASGAFASGSIASGAVASGAVASGAYASGSIASGAIASGAMVDLGSQADAACGTDNGSCSAIALIKRGNQNLTTVNTTAGAAVAAGENHIGEIASNQIKVQVAQTVTAASAYASGNAIGGLMTIAGAARVSGSLGAAGTGGILTGMMMNSKSLQTTQVDVVFFDANPSGSTCTDKTAFSLATADFDKVVGYLTVPGTAANGAGWVAGTVGSVGVATYYPMTYDLASSTSLFACAITRGTPTFTATTDVSFKFNALRN